MKIVVYALWFLTFVIFIAELNNYIETKHKDFFTTILFICLSAMMHMAYSFGDYAG